MSADIVSARTWYLIAFVLAGVCEVGLLADRFQLLLLLGPFVIDVIVIGRGRVQFFLSLVDQIEIGFLGGTPYLEARLLEPNRLGICWI